MKIRIMFMVINMNIGGTERALLNMIMEMPEKDYEITIVMLEKYGGFLEFIPKHVRVEYVKGYHAVKDILNRPPKEIVLQHLRKGKIMKGLQLLYLYAVTKMTKNSGHFLKHMLSEFPSLKSEYDIAVAYAGPMDFISYFIIHKTKAKKKVQWIHFDVTKVGFNVNFAARLYKKFNQIFVVSEEAKNKLDHLLPAVSEKTAVFLNHVSPSMIRKKAKEGNGFATDGFGGIRILTVGRLAMEKGQDIAIRVLSKLINNGIDAKWYCVGDGNARSKYEQLIKKYNLEDKFILLGSTSNPYPFIDQCDIYVQPSIYEGYCITLAEARALQKPIITTNFTGAKEQIENKKTGLIINDEEELYRALNDLINDPMQAQAFSMNLANQQVENTSKIASIFH